MLQNILALKACPLDSLRSSFRTSAHNLPSGKAVDELAILLADPRVENVEPLDTRNPPVKDVDQKFYWDESLTQWKLEYCGASVLSRRGKL